MNETTQPSVAGPVEPTVRPLSDAALLRWLCENMEWDGHGYWLPEICIRERGWGQEFCPTPTLDEFRAALSQRAQAA
jgi:hypothetical protein